MFNIEVWNNSQVGKYMDLHAAIKNTCILDTHKINCPKNVSELEYIESPYFKTLLTGHEVKYQYTSEENYSLLIIDPLGNVIIFDPRFARSNIKDSNGDFIERKMDMCSSTRKIEDPPPFDGIWNNL